MVRIVAHYADEINTGYPDKEATRQRATIEAACRDVGHTTDDIGLVSPHMTARRRQPDILRTNHVMIDFHPNNKVSPTRISEALKLYRDH